MKKTYLIKDHTKFFFKNPRYTKALLVKYDYNKFFDEIAKAGYATDPNYANVLKSVAKIIVSNINQIKKYKKWIAIKRK